jgi:hypothetical protein
MRYDHMADLSSRRYMCSLRFRRQLSRQCPHIQITLLLGVHTMRCTVSGQKKQHRRGGVSQTLQEEILLIAGNAEKRTGLSDIRSLVA